jgi:hypothetical protein
MSIDLCTFVPKWAPIGDRIEIGFLLVNRGYEGVYVNTRCECGHPGSGADIAVQVFDRHGRPMPCRPLEIPPPQLSDFVWLEPGAKSQGNIYNVLRDFELPIGVYTIDFTYRVVDAVPPELVSRPVFREMIHTDKKTVHVIQWGTVPPKLPGPNPR